jgi:hypothetical protein
MRYLPDVVTVINSVEECEPTKLQVPANVQVDVGKTVNKICLDTEFAVLSNINVYAICTVIPCIFTLRNT